MLKADGIYGILSMGLMVKWILFFPYYGPVLYLLNLHDTFFPDLFTLTHIAGLIHGAWIYRKIGKVFLSRFMMTMGPIILAFLTLMIAFIPTGNPYILFQIISIISGYISGFITSRWMTWFSYPDYNGSKGKILGLTVCITYILLSLNTQIMVLPQRGIHYALLFSAIAILIGGSLANRLPIIPSAHGSIEWREVLPPLPLLAFGVFSYSTVSLIYLTILTAHLQHLTLSWVAIAFYVGIGFYMWRWSDQHDRNYFSMIAFVIIGVGFIIFSLVSANSVINLLVEILMIGGLIFIHFYYWLSLVDRQNLMAAPFPFVIGVSVELLACAVVFSLTPHLNIPTFPVRFIGALGAGLIIIGLFVISLNNYQLYKKIIMPFTGSTDSQKAVAPSNSHDALPVGQIQRFLYFQNSRREDIQTALLKHNLTPRETEVAYYILLGQSNDEIIQLLFISPNTLKYHIKNIYSKLGVNCRENAIEFVYNKIAI